MAAAAHGATLPAAHFDWIVPPGGVVVAGGGQTGSEVSQATVVVSALPTVPPRSASGAMAAAAHGATLPAAHFDWIVPPKKIQLEDVGWHLDSIVNQGVCSAILRHPDLEPKLDKLEGAPKKKKQKRTKQAYTFAPMLQTVSTPGSPPICPPPPLHLSPHHSRFIHN